MANSAGAKAVVIGIAALGVVAALAVLWVLSLFGSIFFGWEPVGP
ncbi:hypothetical protein HEK616_75290 (plasmid) [Streptomyces nigrescens]|uniref:Secreted protein n=2 Tax=Streptomyces TaxID=1883 RepID=A0ABN6R6L1_STRNI|nr:hypothetical protein [Streptomyces nigrescens]MEE4419230.1 hypothetical protein [Streptomyces sp. DSM 41528]BDM74042.1 hypothetical protein HEK616_75290 [Streptomyces nigrescens]